MPRPIEDSVVVITGASSGIGRAAALEFTRRGATVVLAARRAEALDRVARECEDLGGHALAIPTDVTDEAAVRDLARLAIETFGRIDVWVNNAAVSLFARIEEAPYEDYRRVIETNLLGYVHGARAAIPYFREQGSGTLINVASVVGKVGQPYTSAYCASKFGIVGLSECLRQELLDVDEIRVCTIMPPSVDTPIFQQAANHTGRAIRAMPPVHDPHEVARVIVRTAESPEREVVIGGTARRLHLMHAIAPAWVERRMARQVEREHLTDRPAEPTSGNLFAPMPQYARVRGGWRRAESSSGPGLAMAALAVVGFGLAAWWVVRPGARDGRIERLVGGST